MNGLMKRLKKIQDDCVEKQGAQQQQVDEKADEFTRLKKKIAVEVKSIRLNFCFCLYNNMQYAFNMS
jgi:hypothetical protein